MQMRGEEDLETNSMSCQRREMKMKQLFNKAKTVLTCCRRRSIRSDNASTSKKQNDLKEAHLYSVFCSTPIVDLGVCLSRATHMKEER